MLLRDGGWQSLQVASRAVGTLDQLLWAVCVARPLQCLRVLVAAVGCVMPGHLHTLQSGHPVACAQHTLPCGRNTRMRRTCTHAASGRMAGSLYSNRAAVGAKLLELLDCSESELHMRVEPVAALVNDVQVNAC